MGRAAAACKFTLCSARNAVRELLPTGLWLVLGSQENLPNAHVSQKVGLKHASFLNALRWHKAGWDARERLDQKLAIPDGGMLLSIVLDVVYIVKHRCKAHAESCM